MRGYHGIAATHARRIACALSARFFNRFSAWGAVLRDQWALPGVDPRQPSGRLGEGDEGLPLGDPLLHRVSVVHCGAHLRKRTRPAARLSAAQNHLRSCDAVFLPVTQFTDPLTQSLDAVTLSDSPVTAWHCWPGWHIGDEPRQDGTEVSVDRPARNGRILNAVTGFPVVQTDVGIGERQAFRIT